MKNEVVRRQDLDRSRPPAASQFLYRGGGPLYENFLSAAVLAASCRYFTKYSFPTVLAVLRRLLSSAASCVGGDRDCHEQFHLR